MRPHEDDLLAQAKGTLEHLVGGLAEHAMEGRLAAEELVDADEAVEETERVAGAPAPMPMPDGREREDRIRAARLEGALERETRARDAAYVMHLENWHKLQGQTTPPIEMIEDPHGYHPDRETYLPDRDHHPEREASEPDGVADPDGPPAAPSPSYFDDASRIEALHRMHEAAGGG